MRDARLYAILDTGYVPDSHWESVAMALLQGGADLLQVRAKGADAQRRRALCEAVVPLLARHHAATGRQVPLIVNDDVELAAFVRHICGDALAHDVLLKRHPIDPDVGIFRV